MRILFVLDFIVYFETWSCSRTRAPAAGLALLPAALALLQQD
jgi:hypothetical protein